MKRTTYSAYGILFAVGCAASACSSADTSGPGGTGGFDNGSFGGGSSGFGNGGSNPFGGSGPGNGGVGPGNGGAGPGNGGAGPGNGGAGPGNGGAGPGNGGVGPGNGGANPGNGGANPGSGGAGPAAKPPCITAGATQAAIIGDSYVTGAASPALQPALGAIDPSINSYKNYAVPGTSLASGGILGLIPPQLDQALAQPVKFIIMDGGGNDILLCDTAKYPGCNTLCSKTGSSTQKVCTDIVQAATDAAAALMNKAANAGVRDVVYFFYPHTPAAGGGGGGYSEILDYSQPLAQTQCDGAAARTGGKLACHFVPLKDAFIAAGGDKNPANFASDGIHPSAAGQVIIATQITNRMKADCLGQASGCCGG